LTYTYILRYMGALSNSSRKAANLAGFYKGKLTLPLQKGD
jgi:hypothetical protein